MKKIILQFSLILLAASPLMAQKAEGKKNIENLCGCFEVTFKYAETFSPDEEYEYKNREVINGGIELVIPIQITENKVVMQHLLVVNDKVIVKHWREDWTWENPVIWQYDRDLVWNKKTLPASAVKGKCTQTVWEVSDAPRYQGSSEWVHTDGKTFWMNTTDAPLPRREYKKRSDYNVLQRTNRIYVDSTGWLHEQDNKKILKTTAGTKLIAEEKGINDYRRVEMSKCAAGKKYWDQYQAYWEKVRLVWDEYMATHTSVQLVQELEGKPLHEHLYALGKEYVEGTVKAGELNGRINASITKYFKDALAATTK